MLGEERDFTAKDNKKTRSQVESEEELFKSFAKKASKSIKSSKATGEN